MDQGMMFHSEQEVRFLKLLKYMIPTYLTSLFNTVYTIIDGMFVAAYVGTNGLAAINIVYPIVNVLTGIALAFATGGSAITALYIGGAKVERAKKSFSVSVFASILTGSVISLLMYGNLTEILQFLGETARVRKDCRIYAYGWLFAAPIVAGKEVFTYFVRVDGAPTYSFVMSLSGGVLNIILDYVLVGELRMGVLGAVIATIFGILLSFGMGMYYFWKKSKRLHFMGKGLSIGEAVRCMGNGASEFVNQLAVGITTMVFNRTALGLAGEDGVAAVSIIMYLQFLCIGIYFGFSMGIAPTLSYAYGEKNLAVCRKLEGYAYRFLLLAPPVIYGLLYLLTPIGVSCFAADTDAVYSMAVEGMRVYGMGFLVSGINIFAAICMMSYGKGGYSGSITFMRSFLLLLVFLYVLPKRIGIYGLWMSMPAAELLTMVVSVIILTAKKDRTNEKSEYSFYHK